MPLIHQEVPNVAALYYAQPEVDSNAFFSATDTANAVGTCRSANAQRISFHLPVKESVEVGSESPEQDALFVTEKGVQKANHLIYSGLTKAVHTIEGEMATACADGPVNSPNFTKSVVIEDVSSLAYVDVEKGITTKATVECTDGSIHKKQIISGAVDGDGTDLYRNTKYPYKSAQTATRAFNAQYATQAHEDDVKVGNAAFSSLMSATKKYAQVVCAN